MNTYPFSAVAGLEDLKLALLINAVSPSVGGVLVRGEKGTAKSTIVRALAGLLPAVSTVAGCRFSCDPDAPDPECPDGPHDEAERQERPARLVELPVGASEDRLVGSLDIERALTEGVRAYQPGLLAAAHRGVLYVDEVNLLHDHLVDLLLDAAAMGQSYVEREGVSVRHASRFLLVGTMNPEEGELRPQLLDRFGLTAEVAATRDPDERAEVVRRRLAYEADPAGFAADWSRADAELAWHIRAARDRLPGVVLSDGALRQITAVCAEFEVDGLRADLVMARAAIALAAWHDRGAVTPADVRLAARLALPHRRRRDPFDAPGLDEDRLDDVLDRTGDYDTEEDPRPGSTRPRPPSPPVPEPRPPVEEDDSEAGAEVTTEDPGPELEPDPDTDPDGPGSGTPVPDAVDLPAEGALVDIGQALSGTAGPRPDRPTTSPADAAYRPRLFVVPGIGEGAPGRRSRARTPYGRTTGARPGFRTVHLAGTLFAAAPHQRSRGRSGPGLVIRADDIREPVREGREGNLVLFVVDASGSMAARQRMRAVKGAVLSLLLDAYQRRDKVGLVTFRGGSAETALPPTSSVEAGARRLEDLPTGGRTPLAAGLLRAAGVLRAEHLRDPARRPLVVVVTDGRATHGSVDDALRAAALLREATSVVVDCESGPVRLGLAARLAERLGAEIVRLEDLPADGLAGVVRDRRVA
ncbi:magnesium chelatase subunit D family protein [Actinoallomurus iriomotensis]|uniref:Mg-protoporphyrin IX chelatase n=1 Tax=Actinoallomurus iriomotensis TaxID=478107 RepID=A0A9W6W1W7_9ACTN|nr:magnesium chelatase subunit D family protein [Actinoallomurus iriomotensis]GLY86346.1 magnesium chelatase [Actinoallomurus iriomotensis]